MSKIPGTDESHPEKAHDADIASSNATDTHNSRADPAKPTIPPKQTVMINLDADVLSWFKARGEDYQIHINKLLRIHMQAHQRHPR
ncbi:BrnA antitoxin family protein [Burkholderia sp. L27(2015)]|uniref:BrnA antitoxin family protein n=1 Tax=Burkholderia sp. L27(2015) TaxID=1641858 RepID=UPI00131BB696|nr:BrnA antitoxin family protein [Burkholderia sp. L27(2015)]